jgi:hypothetical protein
LVHERKQEELVADFRVFEADATGKARTFRCHTSNRTKLQKLIVGEIEQSFKRSVVYACELE